MRRLSGTTEFEAAQLREAMAREAELAHKAAQSPEVMKHASQLLAERSYSTGELADKVSVELNVSTSVIVVHLEELIKKGMITENTGGLLSLPKPPVR